MATELNQYSQQADIFLRQAQEELEKNDLRQAAEKGWGAAAQMIKALAEERGWEHQSHRSLADTVKRVVRERDDQEIARCFVAARSLHMFFYEGDLPDFLVPSHLEDVRTFIQKLRSIQNGA